MPRSASTASPVIAGRRFRGRSRPCSRTRSTSSAPTARSLAERGKADAAIALLNMNQEFYPNSADIDFLLGAIYEKQGDKDKAITRYQAVLTKRPNDQRARQRLTALGRPPA